MIIAHEPMIHLMDISPEWASQFMKSQTDYQIGIAVAKKALDQQRAEGNAVIQLLESASSITADSGSSVGGMTNASGLDMYA